MAEGEFPGPARSRFQAGARYARRQGLRLDMGQASDRYRTGRLDDRSPVRGRLREAWLQHGTAENHHRAFPSAEAGIEATRSVLTANACVGPASLVGGKVMNAVLRMTAMTLGVSDLAHSIAFYEALGLRRNAKASSGDEVAFFSMGAVVLALYPWNKLAEDAEFPD